MSKEKIDAFRDAITFITNKDNVWNESTYCSKRVSGRMYKEGEKSFECETAFTLKYTLGHAFMIGTINDLAFKLYYSDNIGFQWYSARNDVPLGEGFSDRCKHTPASRVGEFLSMVEEEVLWNIHISKMTENCEAKAPSPE